MIFIDKIVEIIDLLYKHGWDERNGGNLSYILSDDDVKELLVRNQIDRTFTYDYDFSELIGKYLVVTGTGKYFKNVNKNPRENLGIVRVISKNTLGLVWGFCNGGSPTSELPTHLMSHIVRLKGDNKHQVVIHCHPDNIIAMTHIHDLNENSWTSDLWKMQTESIVVFPEGVGVLPWMICGDTTIALATAEKMKEYKAVIWSLHGIFATGETLDETFGLIETIEKAAKIFMMIYDKEIKHTITDEELKQLALKFNVNYKKGIID